MPLLTREKKHTREFDGKKTLKDRFKGFISKITGEEDPEPVDDFPVQKKEVKSETASRGRVVNIHTTTQLQVVLVQPDHFEDVSNISEHLLSKNTVVLNLEKATRDVSTRVLDFLSGVVYSIGGKIKTVARSTYIITPYNVDIMGGDLMDELESNGYYVA